MNTNALTATALQMLGDETRRSIVEELARGPRSVGELAAQMPVTRPAVSQHLGALKAAGLVIDQAVGTRRIYRLDPAGLQLLRTYLDQMWKSALEGFADVATLDQLATPTTTTDRSPRRKRS
ncbi:MAG TPA: metalloregulator ArsR/SmtB family transcription factor [Ilumatobacteraceae bacterium]